ncbi:MAG: hypothetical protein HY482_00875 [Candidatus Wildermuthbacteria bacterium]|nr:hypothetical protein [Candidatus Wildermuthbacteria bacterium]
MAIKNLKKVAARLVKAAKQGETLILYSDADMDGVSSAIILQQAIRSLGGQIARTYFPDREIDGYGITPKAIRELKTLAPAVICATDLGISNFKEIDLAKKAGFEVLLIDHHEILDRLPNADIIVDPKQPGDRHPFKQLAACGLALLVAREMLGKTIAESLEKSLVELAALGTLADMMPQEQDNEKIIQEGLEALEDSWRPGIRVFFRLPEFDSLRNIEEKARKIIGILNVRDVQDGFPAAYRILTCPSEREALRMIEKSMEIHKERKERARMLTDMARVSVLKDPDAPIIFEGGKEFDYILLGGIASVMSQDYDKPAFVYKQLEQESVGSVRAPARYDTVRAMKHAKQYVITYGGHPQASGFRLKNSNIGKFKAALMKYYDSQAPVAEVSRVLTAKKKRKKKT